MGIVVTQSCPILKNCISFYNEIVNKKGIGKVFSRSNLKSIIIDFVVGAFTSFCILPFIIRLRFIQQILGIQSYNTLLYLFPFFILIFFALNNSIYLFWKRIKNNYRLNSPPYTIFEHFSFFIIFFNLIILLFNKKLFYATYISIEFLHTLAIAVTLLILCLIIPLFTNFLALKEQQHKGNKGETNAVPCFADEPIKSLDQY